jgi:GT2 family glycosyltransferase
MSRSTLILDISPLVSIIITRKSINIDKSCIENIFEKTKYQNYEVILVHREGKDISLFSYFDGHSKSSSLKIIQNNSSDNSATVKNLAVKSSNGEYLCFIDDDLKVISEDWLDEMISLANLPKVGAVGARIFSANNRLLHGGIVLGIGGVAGHAHRMCPFPGYGYWGRGLIMQKYSAVSSACLLVKKSIYESVAGFTDVDLPVIYGDVDFCLKLESAGYRNLWTPHAELYCDASYEFENVNKIQYMYPKEFKFMKKKWGHLLRCDEAYNPNLTIDKEDFGLAWPPRIELI